MVKSGIVYSYGMGFWGPNGHDGVWHIALAKGLAEGNLVSGQDGLRPGWQMPIFAGETIKNYHIGFDLILAALHKLTFILIRTLYFQMLPPILALLIGIYSYKFILTWTKDKIKAFWGVFFVYFGGSWGWFINLVRGQEIAGESMFWSQQSVSTLINPPFAMSLVLIFAGLYYLIEGLKNKDKKYLVLSTFLFGVLIQIKVYAGILVLTALFAGGLWNLIKRKGVLLIKVFTGSLVLSILLFSPTTKEIGQALVFQPFWFLETMMSFPDRVDWQRFGEAMVNYKLGGVWPKAILAYGLALLIFLIGNLGMRLIGFYWFWKKRKLFKKYECIDVLVVTVITVGFLIPLFFVQTGTNWNTIQFMYYSLMFMGVLAGISFVDLVRKLKYSRFKNQIIEVVLLIFTLPTTLGVLYYHYLPSRPPAKISNAELEALNLLSNEPQGIVLTQPFNKAKANEAVNNPPRPLYLYESTAYVSAFSGKPVFMEDQVNLEITGYNWISRRNEVEMYFSDVNPQVRDEFLKNNNITYLYIVKDLESDNYLYGLNLDKIFENSEVKIYSVN